MSTVTKKKLRFEDLPRDYHGLCMVYLPRPIRSVGEYKSAEAMAERMAGWEENMTEDQKDYFDVITDFMTDYDDEHRPYDPEVSGLELLRHLTQEAGLSGADVARILHVDRTLVAKMLHGERRITADHARKLGEHFKIEPGAFIA